MDFSQSTPTSSSENGSAMKDNCQLVGVSTATHKLVDSTATGDLPELVHEFPWLNGIKLINKSASSTDVPSHNKVIASNIQIAPMSLGPVSSEPLQNTRQVVSPMTTNSHPWKTNTFSISGKGHGAFFQEFPAVLAHAHGTVSRPSTPIQVEDHSQQTKPYFFNDSNQGCPPKHMAVHPGAHGHMVHEFSASHGPMGMFPPQQTAPHYLIADKLWCPPYPAPHGLEHQTNTPLHASSHMGCLPSSMAVHHRLMGHDFPSQHASHGMFPIQQTTPQYSIPDNLCCLPQDHTPRYGVSHAQHATQGLPTPRHEDPQVHAPLVTSGLQDRQLDLQKKHAQDQSSFLVSKEVCPPPRHPYTHAIQPSISPDPTPRPFETSHQNPLVKPSYANIARPSYHSQEAINPTKKGEYHVVSIDDNLYRRQVEKCKHSFIGKITYALGDNPHPPQILKSRLTEIWKTNGEFRIIPLGKGYFSISFDSSEDRKLAGARSRWAISPGILRLSPWTPGFNPYKLNSSNAQVWLRIYELPFEFWHPSVILGVAKTVGTPIKIDDRSLNGSVGHYVRVLVEVDLAKPFHLEVMVDGPEYCDLVHLQLENLPPFCTNCKMVGHSVTNCNKINKKEEAQVSQNKAQSKSTVTNTSCMSPQREGGRGRQRSRSRHVHRTVEKPHNNETTKDPPQQSIGADIVTSNTFDALAEPDSKEGANDEFVGHSAIDKTLTNNTLHDPQRTVEVNIPCNAELLAPNFSALVPYVQTVPKSILKKPSRRVLGTRSWADMAEESLDTQVEAAHNPFVANGEESSRTAEAQTEFKFSSSTQAIVDLVRSKAAANFSVKHPSTSAARAMRSVVTKNWSSGNGG